MPSTLTAVLTDPESFFDREADDPRLRGPVAIVAVLALVGLASSVPVFRAVAGEVPADARPFVLAGLAIGALIGAAAPFVVWLVYALAFYLLSIPFDGEGAFRDLFALVGWGFLPRILASIVGGAVTLVLLTGGEFSLADPRQARQFARGMTTSPLGLANRAFGLVMTLWSAWIWTHAVAAARDLETRRAGIVVGIVVAAGILLGLASTLLV